MLRDRLKRTAPYVLFLLVSIYFYTLTYRFSYVAKGEQIGPDFWPRAILALGMAACLYEIVKHLFFPGQGTQDASATGPEAPPVASPVQEKSYYGLLCAGMALTVAYVALLPVLGFVLCTLLYLAGFMYIGRYRRIGVIVANSVIGTVVLALIFMKLVYVSLPYGIGVFQTATFWFLALFGVK